MKDITILNTSQLSRESTLGEKLTIKKHFGKIVIYAGTSLVFKRIACETNDKHIIIPLDENLRYQSAKVYTDSQLSNDFYTLYDTYIDIKYSDEQFDMKWVRDNVRYYTHPTAEEIELNSDDILHILRQISADTEILNTLPEFLKFQSREQSNDDFQGCVLDYLPEILNDTNKILFISAFDEASVYFDDIYNILHQYGVQETLSGKFRNAYIAALTGDSIYINKADNAVLHRKIYIAGNTFAITSCSFDHMDIRKGIKSRILVNEREYLSPHRGLNFVVFDLALQQVDDAFYVDTYEDNTLSVRRQ